MGRGTAPREIILFLRLVFRYVRVSRLGLVSNVRTISSYLLINEELSALASVYIGLDVNRTRVILIYFTTRTIRQELLSGLFKRPRGSTCDLSFLRNGIKGESRITYAITVTNDVTRPVLQRITNISGSTIIQLECDVRRDRSRT